MCVLAFAAPTAWALSGKITEFALPKAGSAAAGITAGPDGNLWFTEAGTAKIGRITPAGAITEFPVPTAGSQPNGITAGPDGNLWFTEQNGNKIGRITPAGVVTEFAVPTANSLLFGITAGPDGNLSVTQTHGNNIGRISPTPSHQLAEVPVPTAGSRPACITAGGPWQHPVFPIA